MEAEKNNVGSTENSRVVHMSVTNVVYPVDLDLIHYLFSRYGEVEKIVTFSKSSTTCQALVQLQTVDQAREALSKLHGRNIYDGCNTLQIQPSRLQELVVKNNTQKSWDYLVQRGGPNATLGGGGNLAAAAGGGLAPPGSAAVGVGVVLDGQQQLGGPGGLAAVNNGRGVAGGGGANAGGAGLAGAGAAGWAPPPQVHAAAGYGQQQQHGTPPMPGAPGGAGGAAAGGAAGAAGGAPGVPPRLLPPHVGPPPHPLQQQHAGVGMQPPPPNHHGGALAPGGPGVQQQQMHAMQLPHPLAAGGAAAGGRLGGAGAAGGMGPMGAGHHGSNLLHMLDKVPRDIRESMDFTNNTQTPVIIVYNLPPNVTVQMLFNVFSLYGSVLRIKILREKSDTALIQYSDPLYAAIALHFIQGANVMGQTLQVAFSKNMEVKLPPLQPAKADGASPVEEEKRTVAFTIREQRYGGDDFEKYVKGSCKPTKTIFVANLDEAATEEEIQKLFTEHGSVSKFTFKASKNESAKTQMAMMEMGSEAEALAALMYLHNHELHGRSMKVAFSKTVL